MTDQTQIDLSLDIPLAEESDVTYGADFSPEIIPRTPPPQREAAKRNLLSQFSSLAKKDHDDLANEVPQWMISEGIVRSR